MTGPHHEPVIFRPKASFQALYSAPLLLVALTAYQLVRQPAVDGWIMLLLVTGLSVVSLPRAWSQVMLTDDRLVFYRPFLRSRTVFLRQLVDVETAGRLWQSLILRYHPMDEQGRLDIANHAFLGLVPLEDQVELEERLRAITDI